jgi:hypothetical protein
MLCNSARQLNINTESTNNSKYKESRKEDHTIYDNKSPTKKEKKKRNDI